MDELLRSGSVDLLVPEVTVSLLSNEQHILAAKVVRHGRRAALVVLAADCARCAASAWETVIGAAPADVRERLGSEPPPAAPWCSALVDIRVLHTPADLWPHVERLGVAWQRVAAVLGPAGPTAAAGRTDTCASEPHPSEPHL